MVGRKTLLILSIIFLFSFLPLISAYFPHQQDTDFFLVVQSDNATQCNLSYIQYEDGSFTYFDFIMTKNGLSFNQTVDAGNYSQIGPICHGVSCTDGIFNEPGSVCREVTPNGSSTSTGQYLLYIFVIILLVGLTIWGVHETGKSIKDIKSNVAWIIFYICLTYTLFFALSFMLWLFSRNYLYDVLILENIFWILWIVLGVLYFPFLIIVGAYIIKKQAELLMIDDYTSQGYTKKEALEMSKRQK